MTSFTSKIGIVLFVTGIVLTIFMFSTYNDEPEAYERSKEMKAGNHGNDYDMLAFLLYSPGEIHASHFKQEMNCKHCHRPAVAVENTNCLSCHTKQDFKENSQTALLSETHLTLMKQQSCFSCHTEHKGLSGKITVTLGLKEHKTIIPKRYRDKCADCHLGEGKTAHPNMNSRKCIDCHELTKPFAWMNVSFKHDNVEELAIDSLIEGFTKLPLPEEGQCDSCHPENFHINGTLKNNEDFSTLVEGKFDCKTCHAFTQF